MDCSDTKSDGKKVKKTSSAAQFCMCCLNTNCKLYLMSKCNLDEAYEILTGIKLKYAKHYVPKFCTECAQRLINCIEFRDKTLRAYHLLSEIVEKHGLLTTQKIRTINRTKNHLTSNITQKTFSPNHCDSSYTHKQQHEVKLELKSVESNLIMKKYLVVEAHGNFRHVCPTELFWTDTHQWIAIDEVRDADIVIEPKVELTEIHSDEEFLNDDIDNDAEFLYSDKKILKIVENSDQVANHGSKTEITYKNQPQNSNDDSDVEIVSVVSAKNKFDIGENATQYNVKFHEKSGNVKRNKVGSVSKTANSVQQDLKMFRITKLSHEEQVAEIQRRRDTDNFKNSAHKCTMCFKGFGTPTTYESHMKRHSNIFGTVQCPICKIYFKTNSLLRHHANQSHSMRFSCKRCPLVTNHKNSAVNHGRWHKGLKFKCQHCDEEFSKKTTYLSHLRIVHPSDVVCALCGFSFVNEKGLSMHVNFKHRFDSAQNLEGPMCAPCNIRFASNMAYEQHVKVSPKHASSKFVLQRNEPVIKRSARKPHWEYKLIECEQCGIELQGFKRYNYHFKRFHPDKNQAQFPPHLPKPLLCEQCGRSFKMAFALRDHVLVAHSAQKKFQCDICNKKYALRTNLIGHLKTHAEPLPTFGCPTCGKGFSLKANMKRHLLTHKVLKPFKCHACQKTFVNASERSNHVLHSHLKKPWPKKNRGPRVRASRARHTKEAVRGVYVPKDDTENQDAVTQE